MPRRAPACTVISIIRNKAGCSGSYSSAASVSARSAASVYMVRSLLPMAKKSLSTASASAVRAAAGTSTMIPSAGSGSGTRTPRARRSAATRRYIARVVRTSATLVTIGSSTCTGPARRRAGSRRVASPAVRVPQQQADAAQPQRRVGCRRVWHDAGAGERLDLLLAAPVEHADGDRIAAPSPRRWRRRSPPGDASSGQALAVHEQEFASQQAHPVRAGLRDQRQFRR